MHNDDFGLIVREIAEKQGISQVELAERSKVSRVQINRIFAGGTGTVRTETKQKLATALGLNLSELAGMDVLQRYRQKIREKHLLKSLAGLGFAEFQRQPLNTFYVPPAAIDRSKSEHLLGVDVLDCANEAQQKDEPSAAIEFIKRNKRTVILGAPGAGKTTLVQFLATEAANWGLDGIEIPIVVRLPEFALALAEQTDLTILDWVVSQAEEMDCMDIAEPLLRKLQQSPSNVLSLLDGLDEVPGFDSADPSRISLRSRLIDAVRSFIRQFPNLRFVITSRINGFDETVWSELHFRRVELIEYGDAQIREAIAKWSTILSNSRHESSSKIEKELAESIFENPRVRQLAGNPLILTILIVMCKARGYAMPRRRVDLYEKVTEVFLDSWEKSKRKEYGFREIGNVDLDPRELRWLIAELALAMQTAGLFTAHRWWIIDHLESTLCNRLGFDEFTAKKQADPILRFISARAGLLDERLPSVFAFTHRTMQEYFAAIGLIEEASIDSVHAGLSQIARPHMFHPEWSEVMRLVAAQVSPSPAEELLKLIVNDSDETGKFLFRGELLALKCLADGATISDRRFVQGIFESLQNLGGSDWLGIAMEAFGTLDLFVGTRYEQLANETKAAILARARSEISERQYRVLVFSAHGPNEFKLESKSDESKSPVLKRQISAGEFVETQYFPNLPMFANQFSRWAQYATSWLKKQSVDDDAKEAIVLQMRFATVLDDDVSHREAVLDMLVGVLNSKNSARVRSCAARSIGLIDRDNHAKKAYLLSCLKDRGEDIQVRCACAIALEFPAVKDGVIREALVKILIESKEEERLKKAAAYGLESAASDSEDAEKVLLKGAAAESPSSLAVACVMSLAPVAAKHVSLYREWLLEDSPRAFAAARVLADQTLSGTIQWNDEVVARLESILCSAGKPPYEGHSPCLHVLMTVTGLVDERERRRGLNVNSVITDLLRPFAKKIRFAFICNRPEDADQDREGDIELVLLGSILEKDVSQAIAKMKSVLGREVKSYVDTPESFSRKYREKESSVVAAADSSKMFMLTEDNLDTQRRFFSSLEVATSN